MCDPSEPSPPEGGGGQPHGPQKNGRGEQSPSPANHEEARRHNYGQRTYAFFNWVSKYRLDASGWLALGTWALAFVSYIALQDSKSALLQTKAASDQAARIAAAAERAATDEVRPIIWFAGDVAALHYNGNPPRYGRFEWTSHYTNYGRGVATNVRISWCLEVRGSDVDPWCSPLKPSGPVPPNKIDFFTAVSKERFTPDDFSRWLKTDLAVRLTGQITYADVYGKTYESDFCLAPYASGAVNYCAEGNEIK